MRPLCARVHHRPMDAVAVLIALAFFALMYLLVAGVDRI